MSPLKYKKCKKRLCLQAKSYCRSLIRALKYSWLHSNSTYQKQEYFKVEECA